MTIKDLKLLLVLSGENIKMNNKNNLKAGNYREDQMTMDRALRFSEQLIKKNDWKDEPDLIGVEGYYFIVKHMKKYKEYYDMTVNELSLAQCKKLIKRRIEE